MKKLLSEILSDPNFVIDPKEQAVIIYIRLTDDFMGSESDDGFVEKLEKQLLLCISDNSYGSWDGHEFGAGWAKVFLYAPSADKLYQNIYTLLKQQKFPLGSFLMKQYGLKEDSEREIIKFNIPIS